MQEILTIVFKDGELKIIVDKDLMDMYGVSEEDISEKLNYDLINELKNNVVSILKEGRYGV